MGGEILYGNGSGNGHGNGHGNGDLARSIRIDPSMGGETEVLGKPRHGRSFVLTLAFFLCAFSLALFVVFRQWRDRHTELTEYGIRTVATTVAPLAKRVPPGMTPEEWGLVVDQSRIMLEGLSGSGILDRTQMQILRRELLGKVGKARPETSATVLEEIWASMRERAGPTLTQSPQFELAATIDPLTRNRPDSIPAEAWDLAMARTRAMLIAAATDEIHVMPSQQRRNLRDRIGTRLLQTSNEAAAADLGWVWETLAKVNRVPAGFERPTIGVAAAPASEPASAPSS